jgi:hypothetical protein
VAIRLVQVYAGVGVDLPGAFAEDHAQQPGPGQYGAPESARQVRTCAPGAGGRPRPGCRGFAAGLHVRRRDLWAESLSLPLFTSCDYILLCTMWGCLYCFLLTTSTMSKRI